MAASSLRRALVLGCCLAAAAGDRSEAKGARRASRFQDAELAMSRLQVSAEEGEAGAAANAAEACRKAEAVRVESERLRSALLQRMSAEHGQSAAARLNAALGRKGDTCKEDTEKKEAEVLKMTAAERTKLMLEMKPKDLIQYWMPNDCHTILESEEATKTMTSLEKQYNTGKAQDPALEGTTKEELSEEAKLEDHCHRLFQFLAKASMQVQRVKGIIANDADQAAAKKKKGGEATAKSGAEDSTATTKGGATETQASNDDTTETRAESQTSKGETTGPKVETQAEATSKATGSKNTNSGGGSLLQLSSGTELESLRELFDKAMATIMGAVRGAERQVQVEVSAEGSARERRAKQVAKHDA